MKKLLFIPLIFGALYAETIKITSVKTYLGDKIESGGAIMYDMKKDDLSGNFDTCHVQSFENKIKLHEISILEGLFLDKKFIEQEDKKFRKKKLSCDDYKVNKADVKNGNFKFFQEN
jgi:hypothetical protein